MTILLIKQIFRYNLQRRTWVLYVTQILVVWIISQNLRWVLYNEFAFIEKSYRYDLYHNGQYMRDMEYANLALHSYITQILNKIWYATIDNIINKANFRYNQNVTQILVIWIISRNLRWVLYHDFVFIEKSYWYDLFNNGQ